MKERRPPWWFWKKEGSAAVPVKRDYTIISSVGGGLVELLQDHMVPDVISSRDEIGLCTPEEHGDMALGLYLYDMRENDEMRLAGMQPLDDRHQQFPPLYLSLHYMLTAYSEIDIRYREEEKQRILTRAMQVLYDHPILDGFTLWPPETDAARDGAARAGGSLMGGPPAGVFPADSARAGGSPVGGPLAGGSQWDAPLDVHIEYQNIKLEDKMAVWQNIRQSYQLSLFYKVTPVRLDSTVRREISRVREIQLGMENGNGGRE